MFFVISLYIASSIFLMGLFFKTSTWFRCRLTSSVVGISPAERAFRSLKGIIATICSKKCAVLLKVFILDALFQRKLLKQSRLRWLAHMLIYTGILFLILLHALDKLITASLFSGYYSTLNPFLFLRNFLGAMVFAGMLLAIGRRYTSKSRRRFYRAVDRHLIILLSLIIVSGMLLEAANIFSYKEFIMMVEDYSGLDPEGDVDELRGLEAFWVNNLGLKSPNVTTPSDMELLQQGRTSHEMYCAECHSNPRWAFISYGISRGLSFFAAALDHVNFSLIMWYVHFLSSFIALAYLPFSKMFHFFVSPLVLLANAVMDEYSHPANIATRQVMELDACVHCGICNEHCTVAGSFGAVDNVYIMPSEKIAALKAFAAGKKISSSEVRAIQNGLFFCTSCLHCSDVCPVNINLKSLWSSVKEEFLQKGYPEFLLLSPLSIHRTISQVEISGENFQKPMNLIKRILSTDFAAANTSNRPLYMNQVDLTLRRSLSESLQGRTCSTCFTCMTCSSICPVVENYKNPLEELGLLPHQIIHAANLGLFDLVFASDMLWSCLGCYECQESCPQGVCITDVFYQLKNMALNHFEKKADLKWKEKV